jgi:hypothetical protein
LRSRARRASDIRALAANARARMRPADIPCSRTALCRGIHVRLTLGLHVLFAGGRQARDANELSYDQCRLPPVSGLNDIAFEDCSG